MIDTNVTGTVYLIHKVGRVMRSRNDGRILITGSIAGFVPGSYQAVYNGTKAPSIRFPMRCGRSSMGRVGESSEFFAVDLNGIVPFEWPFFGQNDSALKIVKDACRNSTNEISYSGSSAGTIASAQSALMGC